MYVNQSWFFDVLENQNIDDQFSTIIVDVDGNSYEVSFNKGELLRKAREYITKEPLTKQRAEGLKKYQQLYNKNKDKIDLAFQTIIVSGPHSILFKNLTKQLGENFSTMMRYCEIYFFGQATEVEANKYVSKLTSMRSIRDQDLSKLDMLLTTENREKVFKEIYESETFNRVIFSDIWGYIKNNYGYLSPEQQYELADQLKTIKAELRKYCTEQFQFKLELQKKAERKEFVPLAKEMILDFISDNNYTKESFCEKYGITMNEFDGYVDVIKKDEPTLYSSYTIRNKEAQSQRYAVLNNTITKIVDKIINGIEENGEMRQFDLIDYYQMTSLSFDAVLKIKKFNADEMRAFKRFVNKYRDVRALYIPKIMSEKTEIDCQKDKDGFAIIGTGRIVTEEEKRSIINYLKNKNIPLTNHTYSIAFKRYKNGNLFVFENNDEFLNHDELLNPDEVTLNEEAPASSAPKM